MAEVTCRECGDEIPADARTMGLCPRCLITTVLEVRKSVIGQMDRLRAGYEPPEVDELAPSFPQLEILELLACGGMGMVYRARQRSLDRPVALKVLARDTEDGELAARFATEMRILAGLSHPNIVMAYESGQTPEYLYLTMELVPGPSLRAILKRGAMPAGAALQLAVQICDALAYAHQQQVIHRDLKPENILLHPGEAPVEAGLEQFLEHGGRARLADFGLARTHGRGHLDLSLTAPERYVGTADYVAPECREGQHADQRSDLYALGVVLYEMLTGRRPAGHFALPSRMAQVAPAVDRVVLRCLASNPQDRYPDAASLREDLRRAMRPRRWLWPMVAGIAAGLLVVAAIGWPYLHQSGRAPGATGSPVDAVVDAQGQDRAEDLLGATDTMPPEQAMLLMPGDVVQSWWKGRWWDATVITREGRRAKVHYEDARRQDEWVGADRLRLRPAN